MTISVLINLKLVHSGIFSSIKHLKHTINVCTLLINI